MRAYRIKYTVEPGSFTPDLKQAKRMRPGVVAINGAGYCDDIFVVSTVVGDDGKPSFLLLGTRDGKGEFPPSRKTLLEVRDAIDHYLEHHTEK